MRDNNATEHNYYYYTNSNFHCYKTATFGTDWVMIWLVKCIKRLISVQLIYL